MAARLTENYSAHVDSRVNSYTISEAAVSRVILTDDCDSSNPLPAVLRLQAEERSAFVHIEDEPRTNEISVRSLISFVTMKLLTGF